MIWTESRKIIHCSPDLVKQPNPFKSVISPYEVYRAIFSPRTPLDGFPTNLSPYWLNDCTLFYLCVQFCTPFRNNLLLIKERKVQKSFLHLSVHLVSCYNVGSIYVVRSLPKFHVYFSIQVLLLNHEQHSRDKPGKS